MSVLDDENELHRPLWRRSGDITSGIIPQKPFVEREFALPFDEVDELDDDEHDAALDTAKIQPQCKQCFDYVEKKIHEKKNVL